MWYSLKDIFHERAWLKTNIFNVQVSVRCHDVYYLVCCCCAVMSEYCSPIVDIKYFSRERMLQFFFDWIHWFDFPLVLVTNSSL